MRKKDYYTYMMGDGIYVPNSTVSIDIHPDYINVLGLDFKVGDLVETYKKEVGIIIGISENKNHILYHLGCKIYKVQLSNDRKDYGSLSIKKVKKPLDK